MRKLRRLIALLILVAMLMSNSTFTLSIFAEDETLTGSFTWLVEGFDWNAGVSKLYLALDQEVNASDISADTFGVTANGRARVVKDAYLTDADGNKTDSVSGKYVTIEMNFVYNAAGKNYDGIPITYSGGRNNWTNPYTHVITLKKPVGSYDSISLTDNGKLTPEGDKYDITGKYTYDNITMSYASYAPNDEESHPLIIWLHGMGEGGTDPTIALYANKAASFAADETQEIFGGAYVLVPQSPTAWMDGYNSNAATREAAGKSIYTAALMALIENYVAANPGIDRNKIYIGGCSNGGYMTMEMILSYPEYFAAAFPTCEAYRSTHITDAMLETIKNVPIWFTHSKDDGTVNFAAYTEDTYNRLIAMGAENVHLASTETVVDSNKNRMNGHWSWIYVYKNASYCSETDCEYTGKGVLDWLSKQAINTMTGSFTWLVEGYDWGPGVSKLFLKLDGEVNASDISADTFKVTANGASRKIVDAYLSDANGNKTDAASGTYVTIELGFNYSWFEIPGWFAMGTTDGSPFTYSGMNVWTNPYTQVIKLNKLMGRYNKLSLTDRGKLTPESDKFNTKGTYHYLDSKHGLINLKYATYTPKEAGKRPLVIWLHGAGEGGTDPTIVLYGNKVVNLSSDEIQNVFKGAYVLTPQSPTMWMNDGTGNYTSDGKSMYTKALMALIEEYVNSNPNIDRDRIYIGGCSNGGYMTINMIINYPDYFAAAYPICEAYSDSWITDAQIKAIKDIPIWFTHSKDDTTVRIDTTTNPTYARLVAAGAKNVHKSIYDTVVALNGNRQMGHYSWIYTLNNQCTCSEENCAYSDVTIMEWMSQQTKAGTLTGSFTWLVEGYDWGPGVSKLYLALDQEVNASDISADTFSVAANGRTRGVKDVYLSDADGNKTGASSSKYVTIELGFVYNAAGRTYDGSPFSYVRSRNIWSDPYTQVITLNKSINGYGSISLTDNGKLTPEGDKFDTTGKFTHEDITMSYATYAPKDKGNHPLIIWLHGGGEGGTDPTIPLYANKAASFASDETQAIFGGAYILVPQAPGAWMDGYNRNAPDIESAGRTIYTEALMALIKDYVAANPGIDMDRIYIGGCSNGGYMTMEMILSYPDYFAAAFPTCEAYNSIHITDEMLGAIKDIPIWFTHSKADTTIQFTPYTKDTYDRLIAMGATKTHLAAAENVVDSNGNPMNGHWSWIYVYKNESRCNETDCEYAGLGVLDWLTQQVKTYPTLTGSFKWQVEGYDWGPGVSKFYLALDQEVNASDISADTFKVTANGAARKIKDAYLADANGNKTTASSSKYVTIEMDIVYRTISYGGGTYSYYDGNPFTYTNRNNWINPYTQIVTLNKSVGIYSKISLKDNGKVTPESDKFNTGSKFNYLDSKYGLITMSYASYKPNDNGSHPLIVWLHGGGEGGTDPLIPLYANKAASFASDETQAIFDGAYVLVPQSPTMWLEGYDRNADAGSAGQSMYTKALMALIKEYVAENPGIDIDRIYVGGCSAGGFMTMNMILTYPDYFAAAFPICPAYPSSHISDSGIESIADLPIWFTHSKDDPTVLYEPYTKNTYDRLIAAGAKNAHISTYEKVVDSNGNTQNGHWSWIYVYKNEAYCDEANCEFDGLGVLEWLAKQTKKAIVPPPEVNSHAVYINGYSDGTFRADNSITRAEVAKMLYGLGNLDETYIDINKTFTDVQTGIWYYEPVMALAKAGIINGYKDGTFKPGETITRAEFATMIARYAKLSPLSGSTGFRDVPESSWAAGNIKASAEAGYIKGFTDGTFKPEDDLTRAQAVTVINRVLHRVGSKDNIPANITIFPDVKRDHYAWADIVEAAVAHDYTIENGNEVWVK